MARRGRDAVVAQVRELISSIDAHFTYSELHVKSSLAAGRGVACTNRTTLVHPVLPHYDPRPHLPVYICKNLLTTSTLFFNSSF